MELRVIYEKVLSHSNQEEELRYPEGSDEFAPKDLMAMYSLRAGYFARAEYFKSPKT